MKWLYSALLVAALGVFGCAHAHRHHPVHPAYLHALSDLRHARAHLEAPAGNSATAWDQSVAIRELDAAIRELKEAAIDDGKNLDEHPPVDAKMDWPGRLHRSVELMRSARADCQREEDNGYAREYRARAVHHIDAAIDFVEQGIAANHW